MKKSMEQRRYESGRSMVEMVGVLAITGLITAGAFILIRAGLASQKRSRAADEVATVVASVRGLSVEREDFANLPAYDGKYSCEGNSANLAAAMLGGTGSAATPFSTNSCYYAAQGTKPEWFEVVLVNIPANDCTVLASRAWAESLNVACSNKTNLVIRYGKD